MLCCLQVPDLGFTEVDGHVHADFVEVSHRKFCGGHLCLGCSFGVRESQLLILVKHAFEPTQEPFTDGHISLSFSLMSGQSVVMQRESWFKFTTELTEFISLRHLQLRLGETKIGCLLNE
jgi:hypothetical protein